MNGLQLVLVLLVMAFPIVPRGMDPGDRKLLMFLHLSARVSVRPPARHMRILQWSEKLEAHAYYWANRCEWRYPDPAVPEERPLTLLGLSIASLGLKTSTGAHSSNRARTPHPPPPISELFHLWVRSRVSYDFELNLCKEGDCGHYLQVIWANTMHIGCERAYCPAGDNAGLGRHTLVCLYSPSGKFASARPYEQFDGSREDYPVDDEPWVVNVSSLKVNAPSRTRLPRGSFYFLLAVCLNNH